MTESVAQTLVNGNCPGHHNCIALDGDKLKPREDQRKGGNGFGVNEDGAGYTLTGVDRHGVAYCADGGEVAATITRQIAEQSGQDNRANAVVQCYENHAQDSRIKQIEVSDTRNQKDGTGGNNLPLVVHTALDGYNKTLTGDCAPTISGAACDLHHTHGVVSTNSNGEDVAATLDHNTGSTNGIGAQNDKRGGYVVTKRSFGFYPQENRGEIVCQDEVSTTLKPETAPEFHNGVVSVGVQPTLTARTTQGAVCAKLK